jgi:hypothetical protein
MEYGMKHPHIIQDSRRAHQTEHKVTEGIIDSAYLTSFQRQGMKHIVESAMPEKKMDDGKSPSLHQGKASATKQSIGHRHFQGSGIA